MADRDGGALRGHRGDSVHLHSRHAAVSLHPGLGASVGLGRARDLRHTQPYHRHGEPARRPGHPAVQASISLGNAGLSADHAASAGLCVQARAALCAVFRLGAGAAGHGAHRPQQACRSVRPGGKTGRPDSQAGQLDHHVSRRHAHCARRAGRL